MSRQKRPEEAWVVGAEQFRIAQQYTGLPRYGLVFRVEQRTTGAGRAVLLSPQQVAEVHAWLGEWLTATGGAGFVRAYECGTTEPAAPREAAGGLSQVRGGGSGI